MVLLRRLDAIDQRIGLDRWPGARGKRHNASWWRWYRSGAVAFLVLAVVLLAVGQTTVAVNLALTSWILGIGAASGWRLTHPRRRRP